MSFRVARLICRRTGTKREFAQFLLANRAFSFVLQCGVRTRDPFYSQAKKSPESRAQRHRPLYLAARKFLVGTRDYSTNNQTH